MKITTEVLDGLVTRSEPCSPEQFDAMIEVCRATIAHNAMMEKMCAAMKRPRYLCSNESMRYCPGCPKDYTVDCDALED